MTIDEFRAFCLSFKGTAEDLPFDENTLVFKVKGKRKNRTNSSSWVCHVKSERNRRNKKTVDVGNRQPKI
jgi:predicted DNA-binding protein (MmcQ/YjbR family)